MVGYFTLALKVLFIRRTPALNNKMRTRLLRFSQVNNEMNGYEISAPLIAQLGKNYTNNYRKLITGDELLNIACEKVRSIQSIAGSKIAYLECQDKPVLTKLYTENGFIEFDRRQLDAKERTKLGCDYLLQMLRYF